MIKFERLTAAIKGEETDRVCVALWKHFPVDDTTPESLARMKLTPPCRVDLTNGLSETCACMFSYPSAVESAMLFSM